MIILIFTISFLKVRLIGKIISTYLIAEFTISNIRDLKLVCVLIIWFKFAFTVVNFGGVLTDRKIVVG